MTVSDAIFPVGQPGFAGHGIDRAAYLRNDEAGLRALQQRADARFYVVHRDSLVMASDATSARAALKLAEAQALGAKSDTVFLGLRGDQPLFGMGIGSQAIEALAQRDDFAIHNLRAGIVQGLLPAEELSTIAMTKSLIGWHERNAFCPNCGEPNQLVNSGWRRDCPACNSQHFPRTDPAVIMLIRHSERQRESDNETCLLARQAQFPSGMWSCLAGFIEVAETIEHAVQRETLEETGVHCSDVTYYMAQPWPYPSSLMIGCTARATSTDIVVDKTELEDARWFSKAETRLLLQRQHPDGIFGPHPVAIAYHLLARWVNQPT